jgi:hypothetical protein
MVATDKGKEFALNALANRQEQNKDRKTVNNDKLPAGSDMHFDCKTCRADFTVPEDYEPPRQKNCDECEALIEKGWLP